MAATCSGSPLAYWVWHDEGGWHLRTTTAGHKHRFTGWVEAISGHIKEVKPTRLEWNDRILAPFHILAETSRCATGW